MVKMCKLGKFTKFLSVLYQKVAFFIIQLSHPYMTTGKTIALTRWTFVGKVMSMLFNLCCPAHILIPMPFQVTFHFLYSNLPSSCLLHYSPFVIDTLLKYLRNSPVLHVSVHIVSFAQNASSADCIPVSKVSPPPSLSS